MNLRSPRNSRACHGTHPGSRARSPARCPRPGPPPVAEGGQCGCDGRVGKQRPGSRSAGCASSRSRPPIWPYFPATDTLCVGLPVSASGLQAVGNHRRINLTVEAVTRDSLGGARHHREVVRQAWVRDRGVVAKRRVAAGKRRVAAGKPVEVGRRLAAKDLPDFLVLNDNHHNMTERRNARDGR